MKKNNFCAVCKKKLKHFLNLGKHPCADTFLKKKKLAINLNKYPLVVGYCLCNHLTAIHKVSPNERYKKIDYSYTSDNSPVSISHFSSIAKKIIKKFNIDKTKKIIEIGSNDGTFLKNIIGLSEAKVLGVDPSKNMCKIANKKGVKSISTFFNHQNAIKLLAKYGRYDLLYGANVFNHIENPHDFLKASKQIVKESGIIILEVPDLDLLLKSVGFDTIYHEHRNYYSKNSIKKLFHLNDLEIIKIENIDYMAGSLRIYAKNRKGYKRKFKKIKNIQNFITFKNKIFQVKRKVLDFVKINKKNNKKIVGIGAATKGNTLINFCNLNYEDINCVLEKSPLKIGKFLPGSGIKILNENKVKRFDSAIILPWNITKHLYKKFLQKSKISYISIPKIVKNLK